MSCEPWSMAPDPWFSTECVSVSLQDLDFSSQRDGVLGLTGWEGWTNGGETRGGIADHLTADGGVPTRIDFGARRIRLEGDIDAATHFEMREYMDRLGRVLTNPRWDWLRVSEEALGLDRQIRVSRVSPVQITQVSYKYAIWTIDLLADTYPRLGQVERSVTLNAGEAINLTNAGDYPASLTVVMKGPLTDPWFSYGGTSWKYNGSVASGQTISVDMDRRIVRDPATSAHSRWLATGSWLQLPPSGLKGSIAAGIGSGSITFKWRDSWN